MSLISVITINYSNAAGLLNTIKSVVEQEGANYEFIIIDGGSTDESVEIIKRYESKIGYWISEKDKGIYNAQNKGLLKASGNYCVFLNSGDIFVNKAVLKCIEASKLDKDIVYGDIITLDSRGLKQNLNSPNRLDSHHFLVSTLWHPCAFIKSDLFAKFGLYNETFRITGDYEFFLRTILKFGVTTKHVPLSICVFDLGGVSNSPEKNTLQNEERKKAWELNFSKVVIKALEQRTQILRSREYKLGKMFVRIFAPFTR